MNIKRLPATITRITDLSPTAREITLTLPEPLDFIAGAFVNVFITHDGVRNRRAYSISSDEDSKSEITLSIRKGSQGGMSELFWSPDVKEMPIEVMGPLGLNTADKITEPRVFLFSFGIGVSVIKGLLHHLRARKDIQEITIVTASRTEEEVLYKEFFETEKAADPRIKTRFVISNPLDPSYTYTGKLHDYVTDFTFEHATVHLCGKKDACASLQEAIQHQPYGDSAQFLIEAFD